MLRKWKVIQPSTINPHIDFAQEPRTPVVTDSFGNNIDPTNFNRQFRDFCVKYGFGEFHQTTEYTDERGYARTRETGYSGLTPHGLRHTHTTLLIGEGSDPKTVQKRLGHSTVELTLNVYSEAIANNDRAAVNRLAEALGSKETNEQEWKK